MTVAYDELIDFILSGRSPRDVIDFEASELTKRRVWELIQRETESRLTPEESSELETFMQLEHIMRLTKARARLKLSDE
jgi:DNA replicative helicase MCM subunit Mcm2 (Cdc46/Mcm family)